MEKEKTKMDRSEKLFLLIFTVSALLIVFITMVIYLRGQHQNSRQAEEQTLNTSLDQTQTLRREETLQVIPSYGQSSAAQMNGISSELVKQEKFLIHRNKTVKMGKEETLHILSLYLTHSSKWRVILKSVRQHIDRLPLAAKKLYQTANKKQLLERMSTTIEKLVNKQAGNIKDLDIRLAVQDLKFIERILGRGKPSKLREQKYDIRDIGTADTPSNTPKMKGSGKNKRSLIDIIGGNLLDKRMRQFRTSRDKPFVFD